MAAAKRKAWSDLLGTGGTDTDNAGPGDEEPKQPPVTVFMHTIVGNPENPRSEQDYTDEDPEFRELKASMKEIGQLQPLAVMSREVFEHAKADLITQSPAKTRKQIRDAEWVVVTGNRRLAAARQLGWTRIDIRVQDRLGDEDGMVDEAVIIENIHRKNLAPIKEAEFLRRLVDRHGSQDKVAERIGKSQMYVSHRLALLKLAPDIQAEVDAGTVKLKDARQLAGQTQDPAEQRARVEDLKKQAAQPKPPRTPRPKPEPSVQNPVLNPAPSSNGHPSAEDVQNRVLKAVPDVGQRVPARQDEGAPEGLPEQRPGPPSVDNAVASPPRLPYDDGNFIAQHLIRKMPPAELMVVTRLLNQHADQSGLEDAAPATS